MKISLFKKEIQAIIILLSFITVFGITYFTNDMLIGTFVLFINTITILSIKKYYDDKNKPKGGFITQ